MRLFFSVFVAVCFLSFPVVAEEKYEGVVRIVIPNLPKFEDWATDSKPEKIAEDIDWSSHKDAVTFRTRLREGLKNGSNFGGKYAVVTHGCGTNCQSNWVIDVETGKVIKNIVSMHGVMYRPDSRLLIVDLPYEVGKPEINTNEIFFGMPNVQFYAVGAGELDLIYSFGVCHPDKDPSNPSSKASE